MNVGLYYPKYVKEFDVNSPSGFNDDGNGDYSKVHVKGYFFAFYYGIMYEYLGQGILITIYYLPSLRTIARETT